MQRVSLAPSIYGGSDCWNRHASMPTKHQPNRTFSPVLTIDRDEPCERFSLVPTERLNGVLARQFMAFR